MYLNAEKILLYLTTNGKGAPAQVGYDLTLKKVSLMGQGVAFVLKDKTIIPNYAEMTTDFHEVEGQLKEGWFLPAGTYSLTFDQDVKLDENHHANIRGRSSMLRGCAYVYSGVYDPGFSTFNKEGIGLGIGATMNIRRPIFIELGARIAQIQIMENYKSELYNGNFQGEKDIK